MEKMIFNRAGSAYWGCNCLARNMLNGHFSPFPPFNWRGCHPALWTSGNEFEHYGHEELKMDDERLNEGRKPKKKKSSPADLADLQRDDRLHDMTDEDRLLFRKKRGKRLRRRDNLKENFWKE
ncbi:MAG: hypothetical protein JXO49_00190 [Deltaproteobacteria bacterium]|nr:hypothetical protein [Candidatus Anaeroferrophillus wilburensis]MBN2887742.1 hypothetical protein [Deltaproteobacteria bacterium]